jgi:FkbM family methyltransferase
MNKYYFGLIFLLVLIVIVLSNQYIQNTISHTYSIVYAKVLNLIGLSKCKLINSNLLECSDGNKKFYCSPHDTIISGNLRAGIPWEGFMYKYFQTHSNKNKVALDIGANIGTHTIYLSDYFGKVHAFEPQTSVYKLLDSNIKLNKCTNIHAHNFGLGSSNTFTYMEKYDLTKPNNQGAIGIDKTGLSGGEKIKVLVLDELGITNIGFIKIDVEGAELGVLMGGKRIIENNKPVVIFESGIGASDYYGTSPENVFDFFDKEVKMKVALLKGFLERKSLSRQEYIDVYNRREEYSFVAWA